MKLVAFCVGALLAARIVQAEIIMDQMGMVFDQSYSNANGNAIGGENLWGERMAIQLCDDFSTTWTGFVVTEVQAGNVAWTEGGFDDARISFFPKVDDHPLDGPTFTARASELGLTVESATFVDGSFGLLGIRSIISGLGVCLAPASGYYVDVQVYSGTDDWGYTVRVRTFTGTDSFVRDGPPDEGHGGYGWTSWRTAEEGGVGAGDSAYQVEAAGGEPCPPPCTGSERIAKAVCRQRSGVNKLTVKLADGTPGDSLRVDLSSGDTHADVLDEAGRARVRFKRLTSGEGIAAATWGCGATAESAYRCP